MVIMTRSATKRQRERREFAFARSDPKRFAYFGFLPFEIRQTIWHLARPEGRYIQLKVSKRGGKKAPIYSPAKVPSLLHACSESRMVALQWYQLAFATKLNKKMLTYFDPTRDGLYAQCFNMEDCGALAVKCMMNNESLELIKRIVWEGPLSFMPFIPVVKFPAITELIVVRGKRLAPRAEVALAEMIINTQPLWDNNKTFEEHWMSLKKLTYKLLMVFDKGQADILMELQTVTRMDLAELAPCDENDKCPCCH